MPPRPASPNFAFLTHHDQVLVEFAALAEAYVFSDPNSSLIKLRQLAELLAKQTAAYCGIEVQERESFLEVLESLWNRNVTGPQVSEPPFQYIITTTTPPPRVASNKTYIRETLHSLTDDGLLLKTQIGSG